MKDIILPQSSNTAIEISQITQYTDGIIMVYKGDKPKGYIAYDGAEECWMYYCAIDQNDPDENEETLYEVIKNLIEKKRADNFKLIEFI